MGSKVVKPSQKVENKNMIENMEALFAEDFEPQIVSRTKEVSQEVLERCNAFAELQSKTDFSTTSRWNEKGKPVRIEPLYTGVFKMDCITKRGTIRKKINNPQYVPLSRAMHGKKLTIEQGGHIDKNKVWFVYISPLVLEKYEKLNGDNDIVMKDGYIEDDFGRIVNEKDIGVKISKIEITSMMDEQDGKQVSIKPETPVYKFVDKDSEEEKSLLEKIEKAEEFGNKYGFTQEEAIVIEEDF
jgi:hypothetical protein